MLVFDARSHTYRHPETGEEYISATTFVSKFKKPFNVEEVSKRVAEKEGVTQSEIKERWKKINDESKVYGQKIHSVIEEFNRTREVNEEYKDLIEKYIDLDIIKEKDNLLVEEKVHNHDFKLAGTSDIIRLEQNGGFSVFDLKTNKKFNLFSPYSEYFLPPLSHLSACEFTSYGLQLSLYAYMYQSMTGRRVNQLGIIYYDKTNNKFSYYPLPYMKSDVLLMLKSYAKDILG